MEYESDQFFFFQENEFKLFRGRKKFDRKIVFINKIVFLKKNDRCHVRKKTRTNWLWSLVVERKKKHFHWYAYGTMKSKLFLLTRSVMFIRPS